AGEYDDDAARLRALDDSREVLFQLVGRQAAETVIPTERHDQDAHVAVERPLEAVEAAGRRVARDPRVHHFVVETLLVETLLQQRRVRIAFGEAQARGQAVAGPEDR